MRHKCRYCECARLVYGAAAIVVCLFLSGCGGDPLKRVPVEGTITFNGGPWPKPGRLFFLPVEAAEGAPLRPGTAPFDTDGHFSGGTVEAGDGLVPGHYRITVECWEVEPSMDGPPGKSYVPPAYQKPDTSGMEATIEPGKTNHLKFDVVGKQDS